MRLTADWLSDGALQSVMAALSQGGHRALIVGGAVRNGLLGLPVADVDIATDALPDQVVALMQQSGMRTVPTGIDHGTVTVVADGHAFEVTTLRRDVETDGRRATVAFSTEVAEDAARRDFTMNALYAGADGSIVDPLGGLPDLLARRVRFVGQPGDRIREDYLRILRFFRFLAVFGDPALGPDPDALAACAALADGVETLSKERTGHEMRRLLGAPDPAPAMAAMERAGILLRILPGADTRPLAPLVHLEAGAAPTFLRRLAAIGGTDPAGALRLSRKEDAALTALREGIGSSMGAGELAYRLGASPARDVLLLRAALLGQPLDPADDAARACGAAARFPVRADDLSARFQGAALGQELRARETRWIASGFQLSREQLLA